MPAPAAYLLLSKEEWRLKTDAAFLLANPCRLCPRACGVNRLANEPGFCQAPGSLYISSIFPHHGEEPPLSGTGGSGTVFFSFCTLRCVFCQNWQISSQGEGEPYTPERLARGMMNLQTLGCHNINLVTAGHFLPWVLKALHLAVPLGLSIPIVYNCSGYETPEVLEILAGIVDVYLPDMKYANAEPARQYSHAGDYVAVNRAAIKTMFRQVGPLKLDTNEIATRGLIIRHLVLPVQEAGSADIAGYLARTYDPADILISLMAQYRPLYQACEHPRLSRGITTAEYEQAKKVFLEAGFGGYFQDVEKLDTAFVINFKERKTEPLTGKN
jgi:putative pyruvate formate lyase activating enzyme